MVERWKIRKQCRWGLSLWLVLTPNGSTAKACLSWREAMDWVTL